MNKKEIVLNAIFILLSLPLFLPVIGMVSATFLVFFPNEPWSISLYLNIGILPYFLIESLVYSFLRRIELP